MGVLALGRGLLVMLVLFLLLSIRRGRTGLELPELALLKEADRLGCWLLSGRLEVRKHTRRQKRGQALEGLHVGLDLRSIKGLN